MARFGSVAAGREAGNVVASSLDALRDAKLVRSVGL